MNRNANHLPGSGRQYNYNYSNNKNKGRPQQLEQDSPAAASLLEERLKSYSGPPAAAHESTGLPGYRISGPSHIPSSQRPPADYPSSQFINQQHHPTTNMEAVMSRQRAEQDLPPTAGISQRWRHYQPHQHLTESAAAYERSGHQPASFRGFTSTFPPEDVATTGGGYINEEVDYSRRRQPFNPGEGAGASIIGGGLDRHSDYDNLTSVSSAANNNNNHPNHHHHHHHHHHLNNATNNRYMTHSAQGAGFDDAASNRSVFSDANKSALSAVAARRGASVYYPNRQFGNAGYGSGTADSIVGERANSSANRMSTLGVANGASNSTHQRQWEEDAGGGSRGTYQDFVEEMALAAAQSSGNDISPRTFQRECQRAFKEARAQRMRNLEEGLYAKCDWANYDGKSL